MQRSPLKCSSSTLISCYKIRAAYSIRLKTHGVAWRSATRSFNVITVSWAPKTNIRAYNLLVIWPPSGILHKKNRCPRRLRIHRPRYEILVYQLEQLAIGLYKLYFKRLWAILHVLFVDERHESKPNCVNCFAVSTIFERK